MFNLDDLVIKEPRPLPVFVLVDTSGSMNGPKIDQVNTALHEMISNLSQIENSKGQIKVCIVEFGQEINIIQRLENVSDIKLELLEAKGKTPMGSAINKVVDMIEDFEIVPKRAYTPMIVLLSDGMPTDLPVIDSRDDFNYYNWTPIRRLSESSRAQKCIKVSLGIGEDADYEMLKSFNNNSKIPVIKANEISTITKFFKWLTMSVSKRSISANPDNDVEIYFQDDFYEEELEF